MYGVGNYLALYSVIKLIFGLAILVLFLLIPISLFSISSKLDRINDKLEKVIGAIKSSNLKS